MPYEIHKYPEFTWSLSRVRMVKECEMKYYMHYYGSHNGWSYDANEETRQLYRLKYLKLLDAWFGEIFHNTIQYFLKNCRGKDISYVILRTSCMRHWLKSTESQYIVQMNGEIVPKGIQ